LKQGDGQLSMALAAKGEDHGLENVEKLRGRSSDLGGQAVA
jgi:hypothetical protein